MNLDLMAAMQVCVASASSGLTDPVGCMQSSCLHLIGLAVLTTQSRGGLSELQAARTIQNAERTIHRKELIQKAKGQTQRGQTCESCASKRKCCEERYQRIVHMSLLECLAESPGIFETFGRRLFRLMRGPGKSPQNLEPHPSPPKVY